MSEQITPDNPNRAESEAEAADSHLEEIDAARAAYDTRHHAD